MADQQLDYETSSSSDNSRPGSREGMPTLKKRQSHMDLAKEEIICPMCIGVFNTPRSLQCLHSYCEECIEGLLKSSKDETTICCPECRAMTDVPEDNVQGLPINFKLQRFIEILSKKEKLDILSRSASMKEASIEVKPAEQADLETLDCPIHDKVLEYYCADCKSLICGQCMLNKHRLHEGVKYASDALPERIQALKASLSSVNATISVSKTVLESLHSDVVGIKNAGEEAVSSLRSYFDNIHKLLTQREVALLEEISTDVSRKEKLIMKQQQGIQEATSELQKCIEQVEDIEENRDTDIRVLTEEERIKAKFDHHKSRLELVIANIKVHGSHTFKSPFHPDSYFESQCKTVGESPYQRPRNPPTRTESEKIGEKSDVVPSLPPGSRPRGRITTLPASVPPPIVEPDHGHKSLQTRNSFPVPHARRGSHDLYPDDRRSGSYDNDDAFPSDPAILYPYIEITSKQLLGSNPRIATVYPSGVCVGKPDSLIVTDARNGILRILTPTGKCLDSIVIESKGEGSLIEPTAVTTNVEGVIYVVIKGASCKIQKYSASGKYLNKVKTRNQLGDPTGITVLPNGNVLVSDAQKQCVHVIDSAGKYQGKLNIMENHQPDYPSDVTNDHWGNLIISDRSQNCIWVYSSNGRYVTRFGQKGSNPGELLQPNGVTTDLCGNIYVSESGNHRISVFTVAGKFVRCFGKKGTEPGMFMYPRHLCVDSQGRLVVTDEQNHRLQIFDTIGC